MDAIRVSCRHYGELLKNMAAGNDLPEDYVMRGARKNKTGGYDVYFTQKPASGGTLKGFFRYGRTSAGNRAIMELIRQDIGGKLPKPTIGSGFLTCRYLKENALSAAMERSVAKKSFVYVCADVDLACRLIDHLRQHQATVCITCAYTDGGEKKEVRLEGTDFQRDRPGLFSAKDQFRITIRSPDREFNRRIAEIETKLEASKERDRNLWRKEFIRLSLLSGSGEHPVEFWDMRQRDVKYPPAEDSIFEYIEIMEDLKKEMEDFISGLPCNREMVQKRFNSLQHVFQTVSAMKNDRFTSWYVDGMAKHLMRLKRDGIVERLPKSLQPVDSGTIPDGKLVDENGLPFDHLRGMDSITDRMIDYMEKNGSSHTVIQKWAVSQATSSSGKLPNLLKYILANCRDIEIGEENYFLGLECVRLKPEIRNSLEKLEKEFSRAASCKKNQVLPAIQMWHAFTVTLLEHVNLPGKDQDRNTITIYRTENTEVMNRQQIRMGESRVMKREPLASGSIVAPVDISGREITEQAVPYHRIFSTYLPSRGRKNSDCGLLSDAEKEFLFMPQGLLCNYTGRLPEAEWITHN